MCGSMYRGMQKGRGKAKAVKISADKEPNATNTDEKKE